MRLISSASIIVLAVSLAGCGLVSTEELSGVDVDVLVQKSTEVAECVDDLTGYRPTVGANGELSYSPPDDIADDVDDAVEECLLN
jgi:hypothetical protein